MHTNLNALKERLVEEVKSGADTIPLRAEIRKLEAECQRSAAELQLEAESHRASLVEKIKTVATALVAEVYRTASASIQPIAQRAGNEISDNLKALIEHTAPRVVAAELEQSMLVAQEAEKKLAARELNERNAANLRVIDELRATSKVRPFKEVEAAHFNVALLDKDDLAMLAAAWRLRSKSARA